MAPILLPSHLLLFQKSNSAIADLDLLKNLSLLPLKSPLAVKLYHDVLLFFCAYPKSKAIYKIAQQERLRVNQYIHQKYIGKKTAIPPVLDGSGIISTGCIANFSYGLVVWLVKKFGDQISLDSSSASVETVSRTMQLLLPAVEFENCSTGNQTLSLRIKKISSIPQPSQQLYWLLEIFENANWKHAVKEELFRQLGVYIRWQPTADAVQYSEIQVTINNIKIHRTIQRNINCQFLLKSLSFAPLNITAAQRLYWLDRMKLSLAVHYRETEVVTYGDPKTLEIFEGSGGVQIAMLGLQSDKRMALESYIGYMVFKNGIAVAYGGAWLFGTAATIGIHIFPAFRKGASSFIFCSLLKIYHQHFGITVFRVKPYQFGKANAEGIRSGAFWFYYKLGFRPEEEPIRQTADAEWQFISTNKSYRTAVSTLQYFTGCNLMLQLNKETEIVVAADTLSAAVSHFINRVYAGNRIKAVKAERDNWKVFFKKIPTQLPDADIPDTWALVLGIVTEKDAWNYTQKIAVNKIVQLQQKGKERLYHLQLQQQKWFLEALNRAIRFECNAG